MLYVNCSAVYQHCAMLCINYISKNNTVSDHVLSFFLVQEFYLVLFTILVFLLRFPNRSLIMFMFSSNI